MEKSEYFTQKKHSKFNKSPTSFRQLSESIEKRLNFTNKKSKLSKLNLLKTPRQPNLKKQQKNIFANLVNPRSPSTNSKMSTIKNSQISTLEGSSIISKGNETKREGKEWKDSDKKVVGLQFKGIRQKINTKKSPMKYKSPQSYIQGSIIGKKLIKKSSLIEKQNKSLLNINSIHFNEVDQSVMHSQDHGLCFDMSPTL